MRRILTFGAALLFVLLVAQHSLSAPQKRSGEITGQEKSCRREEEISGQEEDRGRAVKVQLETQHAASLRHENLGSKTVL